jgi:heme/copper-type cytochrome/quinol oxidase subunit 2
MYFFAEARVSQISFQDPATPIAERIIEIHHHVFFFLLIVLIFVLYNIYTILEDFCFSIPQSMKIENNLIKKIKIEAVRGYIRQLSKINLTHNTLIEVI